MVLHENNAIALTKHPVKSSKELYFFTAKIYIKLHTCTHNLTKRSIFVLWLFLTHLSLKLRAAEFQCHWP